MYLADDRAHAGELVAKAIEHYERKEAKAYVVRARRLAAARTSASTSTSG
jgi:hypothetical protein